MRAISASLLACAALMLSGAAVAQEASGSLTANGKTSALKFAVAQEVDSATEPGFMDVIVLLTDRNVKHSDARNVERLEAMARNDGLVGLVVRLNPDAKLMSAEPLHPAFTTFVSSAAFVRWKPTAYDEKRVAGRFWTEGMQDQFRQKWSYDITFSAAVALDPDAKTTPKKK
jgi:hypothetical protein